jgi:hypothetical protein
MYWNAPDASQHALVRQEVDGDPVANPGAINVPVVWPDPAGTDIGSR